MTVAFLAGFCSVALIGRVFGEVDGGGGVRCDSSPRLLRVVPQAQAYVFVVGSVDQ